ncbi:helix-turn-helix domain-containing protein [Ensifer sp.]|uniref:TetR/AcrR family transcriptional regulator n=1 Tax=Ensifer sp. TaxID=1872086 RepID=UPI002E164C7C|nr:helix-turn-helix domain-containing protein [Ensifer sp.]
MPRPKTMPDEDVLKAAFAIMRAEGPEGLTFAALAARTGLSGATLVQRFGSKAGLIQSTLVHAWDGLDGQTTDLMAHVPRTPEGAIALLVGLSGDYGAIDSYADDLRILREDLRDPLLRARGAKWRDVLSGVLDECLAGLPGAAPGLGLLMASQWQGSLLWWSFDPAVPVTTFVEQSLRRFVSAFARQPSV